MWNDINVIGEESIDISECFVSSDDAGSVRTFKRACAKTQVLWDWCSIRTKLYPAPILLVLVESILYIYLHLSFVSHCCTVPLPCRLQDYHPIPGVSRGLSPIPDMLPLSLEPLHQLLVAAKKSFGNNFVSTYLTVAGGVLAFHYDALVVEHGKCPLVLCYSRQCGTGINHSCI